MTGFRLAKKEYGPLNPLPKEHGATAETRASWGRFDVPGQTIYAAGDQATALIEALAWSAQNHSQQHALQKTADHLGISVQLLQSQIAEELDESDAMRQGTVPAGWRLDREIYTLQISPHWLVDLTSADTIGALNDLYLEELISRELIKQDRRFTLSDLTGDTRELTQLIAQKVKSTKLFDETTPDGLIYPSKLGVAGSGAGRCFALWPSENVSITDYGSEPITLDSPGIRQAQKIHGIRIF